MSDNHWSTIRSQRLTRRSVLRASARAGVGAVGLALVGCGDDDDDAQPQAVAEQQQQQQQAMQQAQQQQQAEQQQQAMQQQQQQAVAQQQEQQEQEQRPLNSSKSSNRLPRPRLIPSLHAAAHCGSVSSVTSCRPTACCTLLRVSTARPCGTP